LSDPKQDLAIDCCIVIPFLDRTEMLVNNVEVLLGDIPDGVTVILVDDGSAVPANENPELAAILTDPRVCLLRHSVNRGPSAARNTALAWCRQANCRIVILLDSDCVIEPGFAASHLELHQRHADAVCIGGGIQGQGKGFLARLDGIMSWFTSVPGSRAREITGPLHIPTTNMSFKMERLPSTERVFDARLRTGEDVAFIKCLRRDGETVLFSPEPVVRHNDRVSLQAFLRHQLKWAIHSYVVRFGYDKPRPVFRAVLATCFIFAMPLYALYASYLNMMPLIAKDWQNAFYWPAVTFVYFVKGFGVLAGIILPNLALYDEQP
jgi:GT2 family glycosyltransferase